MLCSLTPQPKCHFTDRRENNRTISRDYGGEMGSVNEEISEGCGSIARSTCSPTALPAVQWRYQCRITLSTTFGPRNIPLALSSGQLAMQPPWWYQHGTWTTRSWAKPSEVASLPCHDVLNLMQFRPHGAQQRVQARMIIPTKYRGAFA